MDFLHYPHPSRRMAVFAKKGMVAASQPLAAQAGLEILKKGGNAVDAAIASAAALTVVEPASNGIGGDAFAILWYKGKLYGLNGSGPSPKSISVEAVKERGHEKMPAFGIIPVTVPGVPRSWAALSKRFGRLSLSEVLQPAIRYAREGYPVSPVLAKNWQAAYRRYSSLKGPEFQPWFDTFTLSGKPPQPGEVWASPDHARTLELIGKTEGESFYRGELAEKIDQFFRKHGGFLSGEDLADFSPEWVEPVSIPYRGYHIWELPPNGQGLVALMALNIVKQFPLERMDETEWFHHQIEALKLAFADGKAQITDPAFMKTEISRWLSEEYAKKRAAEVTSFASEPGPVSVPKGGTVYLATADEEGNMVSYIQSNYMGFGSGIVIPGTGIAMQNRGADFSLDEGHPNVLMPGKRTYHTIIPGFLTKGKEAVGPFGVMGGYMQPQGHMQVVMNLLDKHLNPQAALDAPRWQWLEGKKVAVEHGFPEHLAKALARKGHQIQVFLESDSFGRGQIIIRNPETGVYAGGTEPRTDGMIAVW